MSVPETPELEKLRAACTQGEWFSAIKPNGKGPGVVGIKVERGPGAIAVVNGIPGGPERVANTRIIGLAPQLVDEVLRLERLVRYLLSHFDATATLEADDPEAFAAYLRITDVPA